MLVPWETLQLSSRLPASAGVGVSIPHRRSSRGSSARPSAADAAPRRQRPCSAYGGCARRHGPLAAVVPGPTPWLRLTPLERSFCRSEAATSDDETMRRQTLDDLATRLGEIPSPSLESRTRALAWGQSPPEPEALTLLAEQVRTALERGVASLMVDLGATRGRSRLGVPASGDPERRRACACARRPPDARRAGRARTALVRGRGRARPGVQPATRRPGGAPRRRRTDGRDRRLVEHARVLEHDREVAPHARRDPSQRAGLVLASQSAYMALPPETPGSALRGWQRMIDYINEQNHKLAARAKLDRTPLPNPAPGDYPGSGSSRAGRGCRPAWRERCKRCGRQAPVRPDRPRQRPSRCTGGSPACRRADHADARARDQAPRRHRGAVHAQPKEFSDIGGSAFIMDSADSVYAPDHEPTLRSRAVRAAPRRARHRTRGAARGRRTAAAPALAWPPRSEG